MSTKVHLLKTDPVTFVQSWIGVKKYEIRKNDRDYQIGDQLELKETVFSGEEMQGGEPFTLTGRTITCDISHVLTGYGLQEDWCILSVVNMRNIRP
jgi:hypothetical protein